MVVHAEPACNFASGYCSTNGMLIDTVLWVHSQALPLPTFMLSCMVLCPDDYLHLLALLLKCGKHG